MSLQELNYSTICIIEIIANANSYIFIKTYSNTYSVCKKDELLLTFFLFELQTFLTHIYEYLNYTVLTDIYEYFKLHTVLTDIYEYLNYTLFWRTSTSI